MCVRVGRCAGRQNGADQYSWPACRVVPAKSVEGGFMRILPSDSPFPRTNPFPSILSRFLSNLREKREQQGYFPPPKHHHPSARSFFLLSFFLSVRFLILIDDSNHQFIQTDKIMVKNSSRTVMIYIFGREEKRRETIFNRTRFRGYDTLFGDEREVFQEGGREGGGLCSVCPEQSFTKLGAT